MRGSRVVTCPPLVLRQRQERLDSLDARRVVGRGRLDGRLVMSGCFEQAKDEVGVLALEVLAVKAAGMQGLVKDALLAFGLPHDVSDRRSVLPTGLSEVLGAVPDRTGAIVGVNDGRAYRVLVQVPFCSSQEPDEQRCANYGPDVGRAAFQCSPNVVLIQGALLHVRWPNRGLLGHSTFADEPTSQ